MSDYDLVITDVRIVDPERAEPVPGDIAIRDGRIVATGPDLTADAAGVFDGGGLLAFPGVVDATSTGESTTRSRCDTELESRASAQGGVTTGLNYMRTGQYYLNRCGPYAEYCPRCCAVPRAGLRRLRLPPRADDEQPHRRDPGAYRRLRGHLVQDLHVLRRARPARPVERPATFLMTPPEERYDLAHFEFVMRGVQPPAQHGPRSRVDLACRCTARPRRSWPPTRRS